MKQNVPKQIRMGGPTCEICSNISFPCTFSAKCYLEIQGGALEQAVRQGGVIGLAGSTRMHKNGHVSIQGEALGGFRVQIRTL